LELAPIDPALFITPGSFLPDVPVALTDPPPSFHTLDSPFSVPMVYPQVELTPSLQDELPLSHHDLPEGANFVDLEPCAALNTCLPVKSLCCSHIPSSRKCRRIVTDAYITCLKNVIRSPNNLFFHAKLLLFPKYVLAKKTM
jgi:hypothetical protein